MSKPQPLGSLIYPISLRSTGPFLPPQAVEDSDYQPFFEVILQIDALIPPTSSSCTLQDLSEVRAQLWSMTTYSPSTVRCQALFLIS
jgi:hypothetical protein